MTTWRQGGKVPHHIYAQRGPEPDRRPWPDGDPPIAMFVRPEDARRAVEAVNGTRDDAGEPDPCEHGVPGNVSCSACQADPGRARDAAAWILRTVPAEHREDAEQAMADIAAQQEPLRGRIVRARAHLDAHDQPDGVGALIRETIAILDGAEPSDGQPLPSGGVPDPRSGDLHHAVRDAIRKTHARCDPSRCALASIWSEDVAEVLEAARTARSVPGQQDNEESSDPEPRWANCPVCRTLVDRHEPHVVESYALEVLHGEHDIETREAHPGRVWHPTCAPSTWPGAR